jgi:hypothetical protein
MVYKTSSLLAAYDLKTQQLACRFPSLFVFKFEKMLKKYRSAKERFGARC